MLRKNGEIKNRNKQMSFLVFLILNLMLLPFLSYAEKLNEMSLYNSSSNLSSTSNLNSNLENTAEKIYSFNSKKKDVQFTNLLKEIRCVVCQNQDLADSNALLAKDMRSKIYRLVQEGQSDKEILDYLVGRYGDFILLTPPMKPLTWVLWFGPLSFLILGLWIFWRNFIHSNRFPEKKSIKNG